MSIIEDIDTFQLQTHVQINNEALERYDDGCAPHCCEEGDNIIFGDAGIGTVIRNIIVWTDARMGGFQG